VAIELLFVLLLAYLLLGPRKSASLAHKAGGLLAQFNKIKTELKTSVSSELARIDSDSGTTSSIAMPERTPALSALRAQLATQPEISSSTATQPAAVPLNHSPEGQRGDL
jgi:Sec-independent protein translocase protein TatA